jgi:hypothetical protein
MVVPNIFSVIVEAPLPQVHILQAEMFTGYSKIMGPLYGTCVVSLFWHIQFLGGV